METAAFLKTLDYAILKPELGHESLVQAATLCRTAGVGCLCVKSVDVPLAARLLEGSATAVAAVVGFPHGNVHPTVKALEAQLAVAEGAEEIDMVVNVAALKDGDAEAVVWDIRAVVDAVRPFHVKVILETALLTEAEMRLGVDCAIEAGAAFVKTSTGFAPQGGATHEAAQILLDAAKGRIRVKASGGIRTREDAEAYLAQGCARLGVGSVLPLLAPAECSALGL